MANNPGKSDDREEVADAPVEQRRSGASRLSRTTRETATIDADRETQIQAEPQAEERTQLLGGEDIEPTRALYRDESDAEQTALLAEEAPERTQVMASAEPEAVDWEQARRDRDSALGMRERPAAYADADLDAAATPAKPVRTTDKFLASLGLFVLRLVVAGIMGLHGVAKLMSISDTQDMLAGTVIPYPEIMALVLAIAEVLIALSLLFGLLVRLSGLGVAIIGIGALTFVIWTSFPFEDGYSLRGELELLLAAAGVLFACVGGGRWGIDGGFRASRRKKKG